MSKLYAEVMASRSREARVRGTLKGSRSFGRISTAAIVETVIRRRRQSLATIRLTAGDMAAPGMVVRALGGERWRIATLGPVSVEEHRRGVRALVLDPIDGQERLLARGEHLALVRE